MTPMINAGRNRALAAQFERRNDRRREGRDNAGEDDQRRTVADAARGDLLAKPHQEHGAADKRHDGGDAEEKAGIGDDALLALESDRHGVGLEGRERDGEVARILVEDLAALLAFFLQRLQRRDHRGQELNDDRGRNIRHDVEREDRAALHGAAGEHVEELQHALRLAEEALRESVRIDARQRHIGAEAIDDQRAQREQDALLQFLGLAEGGEIDVGRELFGCRCHEGTPPVAPLFAAGAFLLGDGRGERRSARFAPDSDTERLI